MAAASVDQIIRARAEHLLRRFHNDAMPPKMALAGPEIRQNMTLIWAKGAWEPLARYRESDVMMWRDASDPHRSSLWANPAFSGYRAAFGDFLKAAYGLSHVALPPRTDVDHLQAKSTLNASAMIRMEAVAASPNRSHGASPEKAMASSTVTVGRKTRDHTPGSMTWLVALKLAGLLAPRIGHAPTAVARRDAAIEYFVQNGWDRASVEAGLENLFEVQAQR